jgi:sugar transferase (PEP-CTERM system associated)
MRIRFLGYSLYVPVIALGLVEALAILFAHYLASRLTHDTTDDGRMLGASGVLFTACALLSLVTMGLYSQRLRDRILGLLLRFTVGLVASGFVARLLSLLFMDHWIPRLELVATLVISWLLLLGIRIVAQDLMDGEVFKRRVLVLGSGRRAARVLQLRRRSDRRGFRIVGFVPIGSDETNVPSEHLVGVPDSLIDYARANAIREIVVAMDDRRGKFPLRALLDCRIAGIGVSELGSFLERETGKVFLDIVDPSWLIFGEGFKHSLPRRIFERTFDLLVSAAILLVGWPLMLMVILAIKIEDGFAAPVLYTQERVGQHGRVFSVMKFRSMRLDAEQDGHARWAQADDSRVTRVGSFIRATRLDELPQLWNVLRGTMSFVGPRPERPIFVAHLGEEIPFYGERHSVKPGITGWAQLCYPYGASDRDALEKLQYDLFYVKNRGLIFDMMILLQTVEVILFGKGAR